MLFSSVSFLYYFLPLVLVLYFFVPSRFRNYILLVSSLFFYFVGEQMYVLLLLLSTTVDYICSNGIEHFRGKWQRKLFLILSVTVNLSLLGYFKYSDFFIENINALFGADLKLLSVALPIGISFYTFQTMSYTLDVYLGNTKAQRNFFTLFTYVALFPQLVAGPIVRYTTIEQELSHRTHSIADFAAGVERFLLGLGKKVLLANNLAQLEQIFVASQEKSVLFYWLTAISFVLQLYFDFSGYSDMAIGLGRMFGFHFLENFNYPLLSQSITEFWRRWHISLGSWFRDYVYIPLGGNRRKQLRNILIVWLLTGFWHGASWNFVVWGLFFAVLLVLEKLFLKRAMERLPRFVRHLYLLFLILISFVIFNADSMGGAMERLSGMFGGQGIPLITTETLYYLGSYAVLFLVAIIGATPLPRYLVGVLRTKLSAHRVTAILPVIVEPLALFSILLLATGYLVDGSFNPFLYFRF